MLFSLKKFYVFFKSARMTVIIISVMMVLFLAGLFVPQKTFFGSRAKYDEWRFASPNFSAVVEYFKLNEIYISPVTVAALSVFFIHLIVVVLNRVPVMLRKAYLTGNAERVETPDIRDIPGTARIEAQKDIGADVAMAEVQRYLRKKMWTVLSVGPTGLTAVKNRYSPLGFILFHLSFFLCLMGGLLVSYTRFSGNLVLTEGQELTTELKHFRLINREPKLIKQVPLLGLELSSVKPVYERNIAVDLSVNMKIKHEGGAEAVTLGTNKPVNKGSMSILPQNIGVSPLFLLSDMYGKELGGGYFVLNILKGGQEDSFEIPGFPYKFYVRFYPDYAVEDGRDISRSLELRDPVVFLTVQKSGGNVYEGRVRPGQTVFFDGLGMRYGDTRYWVDFLIVREYGNMPLFIGFGVGVAGLLMRLVFFQKEVVFNIEKEGGRMLIFYNGRSEYYKHSFKEELEKIGRDILLTLEQDQGPIGGKA
ncbi:MAG: hypothetical protein EPN22_04790 [Nitrospirae bacterium]|nr:MAG: hypothetical protein EPN22_04790 [Nitrospirota bacterium]